MNRISGRADVKSPHPRGSHLHLEDPVARTHSRRQIVAGTAIAAFTLLSSLALSTVSASAQVDEPPTTQASEHRHHLELDGFEIRRLPKGLGEHLSEFSYEWEEVLFRTKTWERGPDENDGYRVDMNIMVMRSDRFTSLVDLREFLTEYHEKDPATWELTDFTVNGHAGYLSDNQVFWFVGPGVAVSVKVDTDRFSVRDLKAVARGIRPI